MKQVNKLNWSQVDDDTWPPNQPKQFLPLLLIHHQGEYTPKQVKALAKVMHDGDVDNITSKGFLPKYCPLTKQESLAELFATSQITKSISEVLAPLKVSNDPQFALIEGLPGIGKSLLLKEISRKWSERKLLLEFKLLVLVELRNPALQQIETFSDLLQKHCVGVQKAKDILTAYFNKNGGKDLLFLFDGYDELSEGLRKDSLVANILKRKELPLCGLVVSSRPHATVNLRSQATIKVDILGFAEKERIAYIKASLPGQPHKIDELTEYLENHIKINSLCFTPFNMIVLLYLYKMGLPLPHNSVELYDYFIFSTIRQSLSKAGQPLDDTIKNLSQLPKEYGKIINQLSELSFKALNENKLIFTLEEINAACPGIASDKVGINGFGLLQAVKHLSLTAPAMSFNFVHYSIQEYLAANHIAQLPHAKQKTVLDDYFWSDNHANMFSIYTTLALTKKQAKPLKDFLQNASFLKRINNIFLEVNNDPLIICSKFLKDRVKCLRLFRYFLEAGDDFKAICDSIQGGKIFENLEVNLGGIPLTVFDVDCVSLFITNSSNKEWKLVNLHGCLIRDHGLCMLQRGLDKSNIIIQELRLQCNGLTQSSSSYISELVVHCKVKQLVLNSNHTIGESTALYDMLSHSSSTLEKLHMRDISLSSDYTKILFDKLAVNNTLQCLEISNNPITDDAYATIIDTLKKNTTLTELWMWGTKITAETAERCTELLVDNNSLEKLYLPLYSEESQLKILIVQDNINEARKNRKCLTNLDIKFN